MSAQIVINDGTNPPVTGSVDNPASFLGAVHTLSNFDDTSVLAWLWELADKPAGSAAALGTPNNPSTPITPDIEGGYLVRLTSYLDAGATSIDAVDEQVIRVRFVTPYDWGVPAAGETTQLDSARGWANPRNAALRQARRNLWSAPISAPVVLAAATTTTLTVGGLILYDPSASAGTHTVRAPASPVLGDRWSTKNVTADITGVIVDGNGNNVEDPVGAVLAASFVWGAPFGALDYLYDGTSWVLL